MTGFDRSISVSILNLKRKYSESMASLIGLVHKRERQKLIGDKSFKESFCLTDIIYNTL